MIVDRDALDRGLQMLPGRRDWTGFAGSKCVVEDRVKRLTEASYEEIPGQSARFRFSADGFLTYMVRNLVGTLLEVARGRIEVDRIEKIMETRDRHLGGPTAPAHGLCLESVDYEPAGP